MRKGIQMVTGCTKTNQMALVSCFKWICCKRLGAQIYKAGTSPADSSFWMHGQLCFKTVTIQSTVNGVFWEADTGFNSSGCKGGSCWVPVWGNWVPWGASRRHPSAHGSATIVANWDAPGQKIALTPNLVLWHFSLSNKRKADTCFLTKDAGEEAVVDRTWHRGSVGISRKPGK